MANPALNKGPYTDEEVRIMDAAFADPEGLRVGLKWEAIAAQLNPVRTGLMVRNRYHSQLRSIARAGGAGPVAAADASGEERGGLRPVSEGGGGGSDGGGADDGVPAPYARAPRPPRRKSGSGRRPGAGRKPAVRPDGGDATAAAGAHGDHFANGGRVAPTRPAASAAVAATPAVEPTRSSARQQRTLLASADVTAEERHALSLLAAAATFPASYSNPGASGSASTNDDGGDGEDVFCSDGDAGEEGGAGGGSSGGGDACDDEGGSGTLADYLRAPAVRYGAPRSGAVAASQAGDSTGGAYSSHIAMDVDAEPGVPGGSLSRNCGGSGDY